MFKVSFLFFCYGLFDLKVERDNELSLICLAGFFVIYDIFSEN